MIQLLQPSKPSPPYHHATGTDFTFCGLHMTGYNLDVVYSTAACIANHPLSSVSAPWHSPHPPYLYSSAVPQQNRRPPVGWF